MHRNWQWDKMKFKDFFKVTWARILLTIALALLSSNWIIGYNAINNGPIYGSPLVFYSCIFPVALPELIGCGSSFNLFYLLFDLIFWYIISCIITFVYNKIRNKR